MAVIVNWHKPKSTTEVKSFLGVAQYWRKFISNFSSIAAPLHALTGLNKVFQWGGKHQKAFDTLKEKISTTPILALPDLQRPFEIQTDASDYAMGAVLTQHSKHICYHSETFNPAVVNYPTYAKELYALVQSVKKWKHYLMGVVVSNNPPSYLVLSLILNKWGPLFKNLKNRLMLVFPFSIKLTIINLGEYPQKSLKRLKFYDKLE